MSKQKEDIDYKAELEKVQTERKEFEDHYRNAVIRMHVKIEARAFGMIDPDLAVKLVDFSGCSFDEKSEIVIGAREAILELAARKPYLFGPKVKQGIPPPPKLEDGFLETVQRELGMKK
jgi:hypothetical protein